MITDGQMGIHAHRAFKSAFAFLRSKHSLNPSNVGIAGLEPSQGQRCWQSGKTIVQVTQTYGNGKMQFKLFECTWCRLVELHCGVAFSSAQDGTNIEINY